MLNSDILLLKHKWNPVLKRCSKRCHSYLSYKHISQLPWWLRGKESACQCRRHKTLGFSPWVGKVPWWWKWKPTAVFLLGKSRGQRSLVGCSPCHRRAGHNFATKQLTSPDDLQILCHFPLKQLLLVIYKDYIPYWSFLVIFSLSFLILCHLNTFCLIHVICMYK